MVHFQAKEREKGRVWSEICLEMWELSGERGGDNVGQIICFQQSTMTWTHLTQPYYYSSKLLLHSLNLNLNLTLDQIHCFLKTRNYYFGGVIRWGTSLKNIGDRVNEVLLPKWAINGDTCDKRCDSLAKWDWYFGSWHPTNCKLLPLYFLLVCF